LLLPALLWERCVEHQAVECAGDGPAAPQGEGLLALVQVRVVKHLQQLSQAPAGTQQSKVRLLQRSRDEQLRCW
jgi:hypothetical protein